jgi:hypothetical protein
VESVSDLLGELQRISDRVHRWCGYWVAVSLEGLEDPALYVAAVEDRWHFWYLADGGNVSLRSSGDEGAEATFPVIFSEFDDVPDTELVSSAAGEQVVREWFEHKRLSDAIRWHRFD